MNINDAYLWLKSIEGVTNNNINQIESNNIDIKDLIQGDKENYNEFIRVLRLLFKFEQIYRTEKSKFFIVIEDIDSEEFQLKLLQTYGLFCGSKLRNYIKITSSWTDEEEKGITDILRIIENKTYRINVKKENIY